MNDHLVQFNHLVNGHACINKGLYIWGPFLALASLEFEREVRTNKVQHI